MTSTTDDTHLTAAEVAGILRTTPLSVTDLCRSGKLPATKPPGSLKWLIKRSDLDAYLASGSNQPAAEDVPA